MKNQIIGIVIVLAICGACVALGYKLGRSDSVVTFKPSPLVTANCIDPSPPLDKSFGATTKALVSLVEQYKRCKTACVSE